LHIAPFAIIGRLGLIPSDQGSANSRAFGIAANRKFGASQDPVTST
jgi:hypothetical protein